MKPEKVSNNKYKLKLTDRKNFQKQAVQMFMKNERSEMYNYTGMVQRLISDDLTCVETSVFSWSWLENWT